MFVYVAYALMFLGGLFVLLLWETISASRRRTKHLDNLQTRLDEAKRQLDALSLKIKASPPKSPEVVTPEPVKTRFELLD